MIRRLPTLLLLAAVGVALLAGCGSSGTSTGGTSTVTTNSSIATGDTGPKVSPAQEVANCRRTVERIQSLSAATKARLKTSCEKIGAGEAGKRQVAREVCLELALRLASPVARARAQKICSAP